MAADRPNPTLADYVTLIFSPVLIMGLVGSLVFFLLEVLYPAGGQWRERLQWILFFFVFGAVLTGRIAMTGEIASRAGLYGSILALLTYIAMQRFVEYPESVRSLSFLVNLVLVGVVWWCAHRLTWDCTNVDEDTDMSGEGLLQAAGLEDRPPPPAEAEADEDEPDANTGASWLDRYRRYRDERQKRRTLGVWVVYFSLAALPIFGLGQSLIPATAPDRRRFAFWLMTVYVACALGLLLTTCFLGLRRYLRQKRLRMPAAMTAMWLIAGGGLVVVLLVLGALLPRPYSEYPLLTFLRPADPAKRQANRFAPKGDSPGEGKGQPGAARPDGKGGEKGQARDKDGKGGEKGDGKGGEKGDGKGEGGSSGDKGEKDTNRQDNDGAKGTRSDKQAKSDRQEKTGASGKAEQGRDPAQQPAPSPPSTPGALRRAIERLAPVLKWLVFAAVAVLVIVAVVRGLLGFLANFTDWARNLLAAWRRFWDNLFGGHSATGDEASEDDEEAEREITVPFEAYSNPFADGRAARMTSRRLVRYTFAAVEAWARDRDLPRRGDETAMEFLARLGEELPALETEARQLSALHARAEYSPGGLPADTADQLRAVWKRLDRVGVAPQSS